MRWFLQKVVSGGQTGADQAGLVAARALTIPTGGWAPKGYRTDDGPAPWLAEYGLKETATPSYVERTLYNVRDSDATIVLGNADSRGSQHTIQNCKVWERPWLEVACKAGDHAAVASIREWLLRHRIVTLNVAGNRESVNPGIHARVVAVLLEALKAPEGWVGREQLGVPEAGPVRKVPTRAPLRAAERIALP